MTTEVRQLLRETPQFGLNEAEALTEAVAGTQMAEARHEIKALQTDVQQGGNPSPADLQKVGIGAYLLGDHNQAIATLSQVTDNPVASYYLALAHSALEQYPEAEAKFEEAAKQGFDKIEATLRMAGAVRRQNRLDDAENILRSIAVNAAGRAEYSFQMGCILADRGDTYGAIEYFERAVDMDSHHSRALFRLAAENSNRGNDAIAIRLYEQSLSKPPFFLGALLNLGLLYEDGENYAAAAYCFRRVLECDPHHKRAELYLKDIEATSDMYYDEETARNEARLNQLLERPVTDFELSVRSRNCLQGMDIITLGDLTDISEHDLLAGKNFGETSLHEIRDMMVAHGLKIGQNLHQSKTMEQANYQRDLSPQEQAQFNQPISDLDLSVRSRKCMSRLGITTIGELISRTPDALLSSRNFGVTSLNEIRAKLTEAGLKLRND